MRQQICPNKKRHLLSTEICLPAARWKYWEYYKRTRQKILHQFGPASHIFFRLGNTLYIGNNNGWRNGILRRIVWQWIGKNNWNMGCFKNEGLVYTSALMCAHTQHGEEGKGGTPLDRFFHFYVGPKDQGPRENADITIQFFPHHFKFLNLHITLFFFNLMQWSQSLNFNGKCKSWNDPCWKQESANITLNLSARVPKVLMGWTVPHPIWKN